MKYEALSQDTYGVKFWRVRCHGEDPVKYPSGGNGLFTVFGLTEQQARAVADVLNKLEDNAACQAIRDGDDQHAERVERDPSVCWRCGVPLHPGHYCVR